MWSDEVCYYLYVFCCVIRTQALFNRSVVFVANFIRKSFAWAGEVPCSVNPRALQPLQLNLETWSTYRHISYHGHFLLPSLTALSPFLTNLIFSQLPGSIFIQIDEHSSTFMLTLLPVTNVNSSVHYLHLCSFVSVFTVVSNSPQLGHT